MINTPTIFKIFIDTNVFVAIKDNKDSTHKEANRLLDLLNGRRVKFFTSSDVIGEAATVISKKMGKHAAIEFLSGVKKITQEIFIDDNLHQATRSFFKKVKSKNISFIDCSCVVAMKRNKIKYIFSFDKDFRKLGVKLAADIV